MAVGLCLLVHLLFCVTFIGMTDSKHSKEFAGIAISPSMSCVNGAFCLVGLPCIVIGYVGLVFCVPDMLKAYYRYGVATVCWAFAWYMIFILYGSTCNSKAHSLAGAYTCMFSDIALFFWMGVGFTFFVGAIFIVWSFISHCKKREQVDFLRYAELHEAKASMIDDMSANEAWEQRHMVALRQNVGPPAHAVPGVAADASGSQWCHP